MSGNISTTIRDFLEATSKVFNHILSPLVSDRMTRKWLAITSLPARRRRRRPVSGGRWPVTHYEGNPFTVGSALGPASPAHAPPHRSVRAACHLAGLLAIDAEYWVGPAQRTYRARAVIVLYWTVADDVMVSRDVLRLREPSSARGPM